MNALPPLCSYSALVVYKSLSPVSVDCFHSEMAGLPAVTTSAGVTTTCFYQFPEMPGNPAKAKYKAMCVNGKWRVDPLAAGIIPAYYNI